MDSTQGQEDDHGEGGDGAGCECESHVVWLRNLHVEYYWGQRVVKMSCKQHGKSCYMGSKHVPSRIPSHNTVVTTSMVRGHGEAQHVCMHLAYAVVVRCLRALGVYCRHCLHRAVLRMQSATEPDGSTSVL